MLPHPGEWAGGFPPGPGRPAAPRLARRPHSHHWQIMRRLRTSEHESGTLDLGPARVLCAMTTCGDGCFPVSADLDAAGDVVAVRVRFPAA
ncbi:hypothetical protein E5082_16860 [Streptomyces griseoluteus]|uniref:Uncharacterized protein n=1 Tax=Streptomyces griseoluteus TaxID=29306 RepID=A0A4Z1DHX6_STRGP|nr:hypothetical protein [Streptomyces griseoluteus]TGN83238.1 hypothetical protein E5082_16860 [Streptomyces griseoluteus]GHF19139.1 hypothetical protein GCM10017776_41260 [Streptomyces griseoluteus]